MAQAATRITLLISRNVSNEKVAKPRLLLTIGARRANSNNEPPTTTSRKARIKAPRAGSAAKECTEVNTPERTKNAPSRLREKVLIASNTVQFLNRPRFSETASECISAVPANQGINEAFSTGSQNHQPPQPSS